MKSNNRTKVLSHEAFSSYWRARFVSSGGQVLSIVALSMIVFAFSGCGFRIGLGPFIGGHGVVGNGNIMTESRDAEQIERIEVNGALRVEILAGTEPSIEITADENVLPIVDTKFDNGTLRLSASNYRTEHEVVIKITADHLKSYVGRGATNGKIHGLNSDELSVDLSGASTLECTLETAIKKLHVDASGASRFSGSECPSSEVIVSASGASSAKVNATESLKANASGASTVNYLGGAKTVSKSASGASTIRKGD